jgi:hypothetical protein
MFDHRCNENSEENQGSFHSPRGGAGDDGLGDEGPRVRSVHACLLAALSTVLLLSGCTSDDAHEATASTATSTPVPTSDGNESAFEPLLLPHDMTCEDATKTNDPADLVAAFVTARLAGHGAEGCLGGEAEARYRDGACDDTSLESAPGPTVLYACGERRIVAIPDEEVEAVKVDHHLVQLEVYFAGHGRQAQPEHLTIGPGTPVGGSTAVKQLIVDVSPN